MHLPFYVKEVAAQAEVDVATSVEQGIVPTYRQLSMLTYAIIGEDWLAPFGAIVQIGLFTHDLDQIAEWSGLPHELIEYAVRNLGPRWLLSPKQLNDEWTGPGGDVVFCIDVMVAAGDIIVFHRCPGKEPLYKMAVGEKLPDAQGVLKDWPTWSIIKAIVEQHNVEIKEAVELFDRGYNRNQRRSAIAGITWKRTNSFFARVKTTPAIHSLILDLWRNRAIKAAKTNNLPYETCPDRL